MNAFRARLGRSVSPHDPSQYSYPCVCFLLSFEPIVGLFLVLLRAFLTTRNLLRFAFSAELPLVYADDELKISRRCPE